MGSLAMHVTLSDAFGGVWRGGSRQVVEHGTRRRCISQTALLLSLVYQEHNLEMCWWYILSAKVVFGIRSAMATVM